MSGVRRARHLLDDIRSKIEAAQSVALPSSALSKACQYALTLWRKLTRFLEYPELELSNNLAENSMRPVALGRNYAQLSIMRSAVGVCLDRGTVSAIGHFRGTRTAHN